MPKTICFKEGFKLSDVMSNDGFFFDINEDLESNDEPEFSNKIFMSHDDLLKFLYTDDMNNGETNENDVVTPLGVDFNKLRGHMTDLLGNGMVMKFTRQEGVGEKIDENAQVTAKYIGYFEHQDEPFDASYSHDVQNNLQLGNQDLIPGFEIAIKSMKKHEVSIFIIKPEYAFGEMGCPPRIPPNQEVLFLIHVVDFKSDEFTTSFNKLSIQERKLFTIAEKRATDLIATASESFTKHKFNLAIKHYYSAAKILEYSQLRNDEEEGRQRALLTRVYGNLAVCYNKENKPRCACSAINQIPIPNAKSHFNHGRALIRLGEFKRAVQELKRSKKLEPQNKMVAEEIKLANNLESEYNSLMKCLNDNSYSLTGEGEVRAEFISAAKNLCKTLKNDDNVMRTVLPFNLTPEEKSFLADLTANYGLILVHHERYNNEVVFIAKSNY
ncbi:inactive peptidyl-prolyl cis-trans isomerase FKBP6-like [Leptopilina heterotoma]|uniref:inactive peptidyl-prolyl cis-trans isomerase FKBP6-like n=1 Tax=Leptopilina heterotoma TaxID=63436 RepID=UPI001CAA0378|nr:inactive peptidyl-prolyl cis-trans isomerase FKBP6-like [Leptopilina heterotoma]